MGESQTNASPIEFDTAWTEHSAPCDAPRPCNRSKALGSAEALLGITASCDTCGDARPGTPAAARELDPSILRVLILLFQ